MLLEDKACGYIEGNIEYLIQTSSTSCLFVNLTMPKWCFDGRQLSYQMEMGTFNQNNKYGFSYSTMIKLKVTTDYVCDEHSLLRTEY